ncbi:hypothetical protein E8E14_013132 [Neopestalotiopsis sp. 37M]|nr:hypothetical protein E8E14_013132 [Neopestalotiopsis sp. 37M]
MAELEGGLKAAVEGNKGIKRLDCEAYYNYYKRLVVSMLPPTDTSDGTAYPHSTILELVRQLRDNPDREDALAKLKSGTPVPDDEACENLLNLSGRLLLMLKFGIMKNQMLPRGHFNWTHGSLHDLVQEYLAPAPKLTHESTRLPKLFNAWSIAVVAGIKIGFTDNLADHLMLVDDDSKLMIFHHATFLELQQK